MTNRIQFKIFLIYLALCVTAAAALASPAQAPTNLLRNWGLDQTQAVGAWRIQEGHKDVTVAVIDTGMDTRHPDLKDSLWINPGESGLDAKGRDKTRNGIDDDGNGFTDDIHGWNFAGHNKDVSDRHGHGTHIAGIIASSGIESPETRGIAPGVRLMIIKYYNPEASDLANLQNSVRAIQYAVKMKANIINYSGGGVIPNLNELAAIREAANAGILFVAAAGNEQSNSDVQRYYPADYNLTNIMSVTAVDPKRRVLASSNYGVRSVDLAAPGENIRSTLPGGKYGDMTGTSQATAFASGAAALLLSARPDLKTPEQLIAHLVKTGDADRFLNGKTKYGMRLNVYRALAVQDGGLDASGIPAINAARLDPNQFLAETFLKEL
jgi:subtilisin family serine protease